MIELEKYSLLLSNNWYYHDKKKYSAIERNSAKLLVQLGYEKNKSILAAKLIKRLFQEADLNETMTGKTFEKMATACNEIDSILERPLNSVNEIKWWKSVRNKNYPMAIIYLFLDQYSKLGRIVLAIKASEELYHAGRAHDIKDWSLVRTHVKKYWEIVFSSKPLKFIEF